MSDKKEDQKGQSDKAETPAAEPVKASAAADKPAAPSDKAEESAADPASSASSDTQPAAASTAAAKPAAPKAARTKKEKILIGALLAAVIGFIWAAVHMCEVLDQARNPYSQSGQPGGKPLSEADLEKDEAQFAPKNQVLIQAGSHARVDKVKAVTTKAPAKASSKGAEPAKSK